MPKVSKTTNHVPSPNGNTTQETPSGNVLDRIRPVRATVGTIMMSLYGRPKTGKTRLACTFPKPLLVIGSEDGTASVIGSEGVDFVLLRRCEELREIVEGPLAAGKYKSAVLDNGTKFRDMRLSEILGLDGVPVTKGFGFASRENYMECATSLKEMWRPLLQLGRDRRINLVVIAQEANPSEDSSGNHDMIIPEIGSDLGKSLRNWLNAECDYIGQTLIRNKVVKTKVPQGDVTVEVEQKTGKAEYCLRVGPHEVYQSGFRIPLGKELKEDFLVDPTHAKILQLIQGK